MNKDRRLYWIWLQRQLPLGSAVINRLFEYFEDIEDIYAADKKQLEPLELRRKTVAALCDKSLKEAAAVLENMRRVNGWVLTPDDARYPDALRHIAGFPAALYVQGVLPDLNTLPSIAVVSTRKISDDGAKTTFCLSAGLAAAGVIVVSGGARGGDAAAHEGALYAKGKTVLIKAAAPEVEYPPENKRLRREIIAGGGAVITEFPPGSKEKCDYHVRNRLMSGMCPGTCVTEAPMRSGTNITANLAREQGREVFAMPGNTVDGKHDGTHQQIRQGATLVTCAMDIVEEYVSRYPGMLDMEAAQKVERECRRVAFAKPAAVPQKPSEITPEKPKEKTTEIPLQTCPEDVSKEAARVFSLMSGELCPVDALAKKAGLTAQNLLILLTELEMYGCVEQSAGQQYRIRSKQKGDR